MVFVFLQYASGAETSENELRPSHQCIVATLTIHHQQVLIWASLSSETRVAKMLQNHSNSYSL